jgi:hypothetical protein
MCVGCIGYAIRTENRCMVTTFAPPILTNFGGNQPFFSTHVFQS